MCRRWSVYGIMLSGVVAASAGGQQDPPDKSPAPETSKLDELVSAFFQTEQREQRSSILRSIEGAANGDIAAVTQALTNVKLWSPLEPEGTFMFDSAAFGRISVHYRLPAGYDPAQPYPMILWMPDNTESTESAFSFPEILFGEVSGPHVLLAPERRLSGSFQQLPAAAGDLPRLLREVRRRIRIDTDRVLLGGRGRGADSAWIAAIMHSDMFAGVLAMSGYPPVPYPEQAYRFLLENLREVPVLSFWISPDNSRASERDLAVLHHNRAILESARQTGLPITGVEPSETTRPPRPGTGELNPPLEPPADAVRKLLECRRSNPPLRIDHWFRYEAEGHAAWLRQADFMGETWQAEQLSILPAAGTDRDAYITDVIKDKLAYLGGSVDGQLIDIEARNCARVDLLLPPNLVDLARPVTVKVNGKRRYEGLIEPSIRTLLETAYDEWEFQRPCVARLSFSIKKDAQR